MKGVVNYYTIWKKKKKLHFFFIAFLEYKVLNAIIIYPLQYFTLYSSAVIG